MKTAVAYIRRSTKRTGRSDQQRNSIEVQLSLIEDFCRHNHYHLEEIFVEECSGTIDERQVWKQAQDCAEKNGHIVVVLSVCRLARSLTFFSKIKNFLPSIRFVQLGDRIVEEFMIGMLLSVASLESQLISRRCKNTHRYLKDKLGEDYRVGNPNINTNCRPKGLEVRKRRAAEFNQKIQNYASALGWKGRERKGISLLELVENLNGLGLRTRRGAKFTTGNLQRILAYS
jgi:DNA invertase Pin-like site-specific DNA recombinase